MWCPLSGSAVLSGRPASSPVWCPACPVSGRPVVSRLLSAPSVRTRPSHPTSGGGVGDQVAAAGTRHHSNGSSPGGLPRRGAARSTAEQARTRATLPGSRVGQWGSVADPGRVGCGRRPRLTAGDQAGLAGVRSAVANGCAVGTGAGCSARWPQRPRGCRSGLGWVDHGGWGRGACRSGGRAGRASGRAGGDGRAAPARPRLAAGTPGSPPTAL
jgi:hypothetical protein